MACFVPTYRPFRPARIFKTSVRWPLHGATVQVKIRRRCRCWSHDVSDCQSVWASFFTRDSILHSSGKRAAIYLWILQDFTDILFGVLQYIITPANTTVAVIFPTSRIGSHSYIVMTLGRSHQPWVWQCLLGASKRSRAAFFIFNPSLVRGTGDSSLHGKRLVTWESGC